MQGFPTTNTQVIDFNFWSINCHGNGNDHLNDHDGSLH